jgi:ATP-dependent DNA helicase RecQ
MIGYITDKNLCHSVFLLRYFGEENAADCGRCDVCRKKKGRLDSEFAQIWAGFMEALSSLRQKEFTDAKSLLAACGLKESDLALQCLDLAVDEGYLTFHPANGYRLPG